MTTLSAMIAGDNIDARVMVAHQVEIETSWRVRGVKVTPADIERKYEGGLRSYLEDSNFEPLL